MQKMCARVRLGRRHLFTVARKQFDNHGDFARFLVRLACFSNCDKASWDA